MASGAKVSMDARLPVGFVRVDYDDGSLPLVLRRTDLERHREDPFRCGCKFKCSRRATAEDMRCDQCRDPKHGHVYVGPVDGPSADMREIGTTTDLPVMAGESFEIRLS